MDSLSISSNFRAPQEKKKVSRALSPNPNILLALKINSGPIVCIHLLPTRKNSLSNIARGRESQEAKKSLSNQGLVQSIHHRGDFIHNDREGERERNPAYEPVGFVQEI